MNFPCAHAYLYLHPDAARVYGDYPDVWQPRLGPLRQRDGPLEAAEGVLGHAGVGAERLVVLYPQL